MACNQPFLMKNKDGNLIPVPCGRCLQCRIDKRNEWTMRLSFEVDKSKGSFVTLTYDDIHLLDDSLHKEHVQLFIKRLRKHINNQRKIKYYAVGEYGQHGNIVTGLQRPHYHLIITGFSALEISKYVVKSWDKGFTKTLPANRSTIRYTLKYMDKQLHGEKAKKEYGDKLPPFALMSQGIGLDWMHNNKDVVEYFGGIPFNGKIRPVPRYYVDNFDFSKGNSISLDKKRTVLEYMKKNNCDFIQALNSLGKVNEIKLEKEINLYNKN